MRDATLSERLQDALRILLVYLIAGPLIGFAAFYALAITASLTRGDSSISYSWVLPGLFVGLLLAYPVGVVYAFLTGLVVCLCRIWLRRVTLQIVVIAPLIAAYPGSVGILLARDQESPYGIMLRNLQPGSLTELMLNAVIGLAASIGCWVLLRRQGLAE